MAFPFAHSPQGRKRGGRSRRPPENCNAESTDNVSVSVRAGMELEVSVRRHWLGKVFAIASNTATEALRQPVFSIILAIAIGLIVLSPFLTMFTLMEGPKMMKDMGLATMFLAGVLLAAFAASNVVSEEIENHTALTVMSKPVGRFEFIIGKYLGVLGAVTVAFYLMALSLILAVALGGFEAGAMQTTNWSVIVGLSLSLVASCGAGMFANYFYDGSFTSVAVKTAVGAFTLVFLVFCFVHPEELTLGAFGVGINADLAHSALLIYLSMLILVSVALAASTRLNVVVNLVVCTIIFYLGLMSDFLFGMHRAESLPARIAYLVTPNLQMFWTADILAVEGTAVPFFYVVHMAGYALCFSAAALLVAMVLFEERQLS